MKLRSTGLGTTELIGECVSLEPNGEYLVMTMKTLQPVRWKIRVAITSADLRQLLGITLSWKIIWHVLFKVFKRWNSPGPNIDF